MAGDVADSIADSSQPDLCELELVASKWSAEQPELSAGFFGFPPLRPYLIETAFGQHDALRHSGNRYWAEDLVAAHHLAGRRIENVLSLCCGFGEVERRYLSILPGVHECTGVDLAAGAIAAAERHAAREGLRHLRYECADLNRYDWPEQHYDLVIANGALHHLRELERVLDGVRRTLRPGGILCANEHVGANHQDYPKRQLELINAAAYLIPPELRSRTYQPNPRLSLIRKFLHRGLGVPINIPDPASRADWSIARKATAAGLRRVLKPIAESTFGTLYTSRKEYMLRTDPSEGVRSADIIPVIKGRFSRVQIRPYGGGILAYALDSRFYKCYDDANADHRRLLRLLCELERHCMTTGQIGMEHAIIVAEL